VTSRATDAQTLANDGLTWLLDQATETPHGLVWTGTASDDEIDPTLYSGAAGIVLTLLEAHAYFAHDRYADAAVRAAQALASMVDEVENCSLYFGLTGMAVALQAVGDRLDDDASAAAAGRALQLVSSRFDGERWGEQFDLLGGNAGITLGALSAGAADLAQQAVEPYLRTAEPTDGGVQWEVRTGVPARFHHLSHGTLGIVAALAAVGAATGRTEMIDLALAGAADVVSRNEADESGFLVPHSDPPHLPELIERYSYGWCHGPAGDAQAFRLLGAVTGDPAWAAMADRCWHTVTHSGLPVRVRPGFWDNSGRCCGTAGVLALACDRVAEGRDGLDFAAVLVDDLAARATVDGEGARWSNHEHRVTPSDLEPRTGWAMGNAGIVRELLRFAGVTAGRESTYAVAWPEHPPVALSGDLGRP
jgi:Lanthionine synthetase C-like protein